MKEWDYANMAHTAKLHGGPEEYVDVIFEKGMQEGIKQGRTQTALIISGVAAGWLIIKALFGKRRTRRIITDEEYVQARESLVSEIKEEMQKEERMGTEVA